MPESTPTPAAAAKFPSKGWCDTYHHRPFDGPQQIHRQEDACEGWQPCKRDEVGRVLSEIYDELHRRRVECREWAADPLTPDNMRGALFDRAGGLEAAAAVVAKKIGHHV